MVRGRGRGGKEWEEREESGGGGGGGGGEEREIIVGMFGALKVQARGHPPSSLPPPSG